MYRLIGAASGWGAQIRACEEGPEILKEQHLLEKLRKRGISITDFKILHPQKRTKQENIPLPKALPIIHDFNMRLSNEVERTLQAGEFPIVLGGDHSIAVGTWNGVHHFLQKKESLPMGLIWIDAHMDSHTPQTSHSGAWHGMPLAALLGRGDPSMSKLITKESVLDPQNLCLIGIRSFEEGEAELLKRLKVRIFFAEEVKEKGIGVVLKEALLHIKRRTKAIGVSLDLDVITSEEAPGVGSPEAGGIHAKELIKALELLKNEPTLKAFELVEYNPQRNQHLKTGHLCVELLSAFTRSDH